MAVSCTILLLTFILLTITGLSSSQEAYFGYGGYTQFLANEELSRANESLILRFKFCQTDGILLHATDASRFQYFSIGVYHSRILVEFSFHNDLREISQSGTILQSNIWYSLELRNLGQGSDNFTMLLNGQTASVVTDSFSGISFASLNGPLFIGGHPQPQTIQALRLRCTTDVCISEVTTPSGSLDLLSTGEGVAAGCPATQCQILSSLTFSSPSSSVTFPLEERTVSSFKLQTRFQTSLSNGLLATIGSQSSSDFLVVYLSEGHVAVNFSPYSNTPNPGHTIVTQFPYNDSQMHQLQFMYGIGQIQMIVDGTDTQFARILTYSFSQSHSIQFGAVPDNVSLPAVIPAAAATQSFRGCLYNLGYSNTGHLTLFNTNEASMMSGVTLDVCLPELTCPQECHNVSQYCHFECTCAAGFNETGPNECTEIKACDSNPCLNGATCLDLDDGNFTCSCPPGFTGATCDTDVDECFSNDPCHNGGTCVNRVNGFDCQCATGFTGSLCEGDVHDCLFNPCLNNGICVERSNGSTECHCMAGWIGITCGESYDECSSNPCLNGADCIDGHLSYTCVCRSGYTGDNCEININDCDPNPCFNNGTCIDLISSYYCYCDTDYFGNQCEFQHNTCDALPCQNNATCVNTPPAGYQCQCSPGYTGQNCDVICALNSNGTCQDMITYAIVVHRHGDRSPLFSYPTSPNSEDSWPQGLGHLSITGMKQAYLLGSVLRRRYVSYTKLLSANYTRTQVSVVSTESDRTIMSIGTALAALFPPSLEHRFLADLNWQPVPVFVLHPHEYILLPASASGPDCLAYQRLLLAEQATLFQLQIKYQSFFDTLAGYTGMSVNINNVALLADTLIAEYFSNRAPSWFNQTIRQTVESIVDQLLNLLTNTDEKRRLTGGVWAHRVMELMEMKANGTLPNSEASKLAIYSAHDITVATMLSVFGVYDGIRPSYTAAFAIELYSSDGQHYVQFLYRKRPWSKIFHRLSHPSCRDSQGRCPLSQLQQIVQGHRLTIPQWEQECG